MKMARWGVAIWIGAALATAGCGKTQPVLIGAVGDLETGGRAGTSGFRNGIAYAEEAINDRGGVDGSLVDVVFSDDQGDPDFVPKVDEKLVARRVLALLGHNTSSTTAAALPITDRHKTLLMGPEATSSEFSGRDDYFVRVEVAEQSMAEALADYAIQKMRLRSIGVILDEKNRPFSRPFFESFRKRMKSLGGEAELLYPYSALDRAEAGRQVAGFVARRGEAVLLIADAADSRMLGELVRKVRSNFPLLGTPWVMPATAVDGLAAAPEGMVFPCTWDPDSTAPAYLEFKEGYEKRFSAPVDYHAVHAYEAMMILARGVEKAGRDRRKIGKAITTIARFDGLQGPIQIDSFGDCRRQVYLLRFVAGNPHRVDLKSKV